MLSENKAKHTPGPWTGDSYYGTTDRPEIMGRRRSIAVVQQASEEYESEATGLPKQRLATNEEVWANARLIAAAPDSNAANVAALEYLCDENPRADRRHEVIVILQAAIAKATGGAA